MYIDPNWTLVFTTTVIKTTMYANYYFSVKSGVILRQKFNKREFVFHLKPEFYL